jgi:hypothetical protein
MKLKPKKKHRFSFISWSRHFAEEWWWVVIFIFASYYTFVQVRSDLHREKVLLLKKFEEIEQMTACAYEQQKELELSLFSQSDPEWIKLTLKRKLGVVPAGQTKVYFKGDS